jgi:eukaryotic-like serine/threonine-protein kinase
MYPSPPEADNRQELQFGKALAEYLRRADGGEVIDRSQFLAEHADVADLLREYFESADEISSLTTENHISNTEVTGQFPYRFGDYELLKEIARGGRGVVYRAVQLSLSRPVAIKMILGGHLVSSDDVQRFWKEAHAVASLRHPNIVSIHDVGEHDGRHYISMELIEGQNLAEIVRRNPLSGKKAATYSCNIASAIQHAHNAGLLHRDLKPSNVIVDESDQVKVTDFGFAKELESADGQTLTGQILGTPSYMPPEQAIGDNRSLAPTCDIYSMGAVLYELVTGRPPFRAESTIETLRQVIELEAPRPRTLNPNVPRDLETIILKCLAKEPSRRYQTADELADDLSRYLQDEPIHARPPSISGWVWRWSRRNRGWSAAIVFGTCALAALMVGATLASNALSVSRGRESLLQLQSIERTSGWSEHAWEVIKQAAQVGKDDTLQSQAALALTGIDARVGRQFLEFGAEQAVWDQRGECLLIATLTNSRPATRGVGLWSARTDSVSAMPSPGAGPVGFSRDGQPVQLAVGEDGSSLTLWNLENTQVLREFSLPEGWNVVTNSRPRMAADSETCSAVIGNAQGEYQYAVWQGDTTPKVISASLPEEAFRVVYELSDDGSLLAVSEKRGEVKVFSVDEGNVIAHLRVGRHKIHTVKFGRDRRHVLDRPAGDTDIGWILATADAGGKVATWDLGSQSPLAFYHGSLFDVYQVEFSPDGMTLASSGRGPSRLWDVATGKQLLEIDSADIAVTLSFSPDGKRLAVGTVLGFAPGRLAIWDLDFGRGIRTLRGLSAPVSHICISADGSTVGALAHDWTVAIWDAKKSHLQTLLEVPPGASADNAALALSHDGSQLAYCSGKNALLIDTKENRILKTWELPAGFVDLFAVVPPDQLILIRTEVNNERLETRMRDLYGESPLTPIATILDFPAHVFGAAVGSEGPYLVIDGLGGPNGEQRMLRIYDLDGKLVKPLPTAMHVPFTSITVDETGTLAAVRVAVDGPNGPTKFFNLPDGQTINSRLATPLCISSGKKLMAASGSSVLEGRGITLYQLDSQTALVTFDVDAVINNAARFGANASLLAWGRRDGMVRIAKLSEVKEQLNRVGLGW